MVKRRTGLNTLAYMGVEAATPPNFIEINRAPTSNDVNYNIGTFWLNTSTQALSYLSNLDGSSATWTTVGGGGGGASTFVTDSGSAVESGSTLNVFGGTNINTAGSGLTVTVNLDSSISLAGTVSAASNITSTGGDLVADTGNISSTSGSVSAGTTVTAGTSMSSGTTITAGTDLIATDDLTAGGTVTFSALSAGVMQTNGSGVVSSNNGNDGEVLIGGGSAPAWANITSGDGSITVSNGANTIDIAVSTPSSGIMWSVITGASKTMVVNEGYFANNGGTLAFTLPSSASVGDTLAVYGMNNATGWTIAQNAGQTIHFGAQDTTTGVGGSLASTSTFDGVLMVCNVANTDFVVIQSIGNVDVT